MNASVITRLCLNALGLLAIAPALAQTYPDRVVKFIVPFSAGGVSDVATRAVAQKLGSIWPYAPIIENRPGAGGTIGADQVAKAKPDGYTLLLTGSTHLVSGALYKRLPYETVGDFAPIVVFAQQPSVLVVHPSVTAKSVAELVALAKAEPGKMNYASSGNGSSQHLFAALFLSMAGAQMTHVPYKGSGPALADLLSGLVPVSFPSVSNALPYINAGKLRALGVSSTKRLGALPDVPTLDEAGVKGYDAQLWFAAMGPKGMSPELVAKIHQGIAEATRSPEVLKAFAGQGIEALNMPPAEFAKYILTEQVKWARVVKESGATID
jgi:tripartite-type tricarboxylate transporter receptor subunit TctC